MSNLLYSNTTIKILWKMMNGQMPCLFREITGLHCPGCGGTRAVKVLLKGELLRSFLYHPLILYMVIVVIGFALSGLVYRFTKNEKYRLHLDNHHVYVGIVIIVINFVVKNYLLLFEGIDLLEMLANV